MIPIASTFGPRLRRGGVGAACTAAVLVALAGGCGSTPERSDSGGSASLADLAAPGAGGPTLTTDPDRALEESEDPTLADQIRETVALLEGLGLEGLAQPATDTAEPDGTPDPEGVAFDDLGGFGLAGAAPAEAEPLTEIEAEPAVAEAAIAEAGTAVPPEPEVEPVVEEPAPPLTIAGLLDKVIDLLPEDEDLTPLRRALLGEVAASMKGVEAPGAGVPLAPGEQAAAEVVGGLVRAVLALEDPPSFEDVRSAVQEVLAPLAEGAAERARVVRIERVELCSRVAGFGEFDLLGTERFLAGQVNRLIVYMELEGLRVRTLDGLARDPAPGTLAERTAEEDRRYVVETSVQVQLFEPGGLNVWNTNTETYRRETRTPARDHHRIRVISLPSNLGVGRYDLKVVVRDEIGGSLAEAVIPVELVADRGLLTRGPGD